MSHFGHATWVMGKAFTKQMPSILKFILKNGMVEELDCDILNLFLNFKPRTNTFLYPQLLYS